MYPRTKILKLNIKTLNIRKQKVKRTFTLPDPKLTTNAKIKRYRKTFAVMNVKEFWIRA